MSLTNFSAPSAQQDHFSVSPQINVQRSVFDRTHGYKTTFDSGYLIPFEVDEILPGDTVKMKSSFFARLSTPIFPLMDNLYMDVHFWFVPNRLLWSNWERFQGAQDDPNDTVDYLVPTMTSPVGGYAASTLYDYMGLPTKIAGIEHISLPMRAYNLIWNEWYRDENLQNSVVVDKDDGPDNPSDYVLLRRGKRHDYFTSCLPWTQKGVAIDLPISGNAPIITAAGSTELVGVKTTTDNTLRSLYRDNASFGIRVDTAANASKQMYADLSNVSAASVNDLRQAFQLQRLLEKDARGGTRYVEMLKSQFGVIAPDFRLQRPEFLGGGRAKVSITQVAQTSETGATTPQGNLAAFGTILGHDIGFVKSFVEHGILIGLLSVRSDMNYQQGINRMWTRQTRYDYYMPVLAHLGEQAVLNKEIYCQGSGNPTQDEAVFGYQERWAEYRYKPNIITGEFRSNFAQTLDSWHLAQNFASLPVLGATFIQENPPVKRVIAVETEPDFILDSYHQTQWARPMPVYSVPGFMDHF